MSYGFNHHGYNLKCGMVFTYFNGNFVDFVKKNLVEIKTVPVGQEQQKQQF